MSRTESATAPHVAICSLVRDGMAYLPAYRRQLESLRLPGGLQWQLFILEGDSRDDSHAFLTKWAQEDSRITVAREHAGDSTDKEDRAARWARVGNTCFGLVPESGPHTHVLWLETDLCFPPELLHRLLDHRVDIVAPMIFLGGLFYDTWGFRDLEGRSWRGEAPYHPSYRPMALMDMGSVGSCVLFRREILDAGIRFKGTYEQGLLVGMCNDARAKGFKVFADTGTAILHPVDQWEEQMWRPTSLRIVYLDGAEESLTPAQARPLGLDFNLPLLDPSTLRKAQGGLLWSLFQRLNTNRIVVEATARVVPRKSYDLLIRAQPPKGIRGTAPFRRAIFALERGHFNPLATKSPGSFRGRLLRRTFKCRVSIALEGTP